jgi:hypothetical protein
VDGRLDDDDVSAILGGIFDANARLEAIRIEVQTIRVLLEDGDEEEEEGAGGDEP